MPLVYHDEEEIPEEGLDAADKTKKSFIFNITQLRSYSLKDVSKALKYRRDCVGPFFGLDLEIGKNVTSNLGQSYESDSTVSIDSL